MRFKKLTILVTSGAVLLGAIGITKAQQAGRLGRLNRPAAVALGQGKLGEKLNLTAEQRQSLRKWVVANRFDVADVLDHLREHRQALQDAAAEASPDEAAVKKAGEDVGKDLADAALLIARFRKENAGLFTDEQAKTWHEFVDQVDLKLDDAINQLNIGR